MKTILSSLIICIFIIASANAQVYAEKQTRHRFAQLTIGYEYTTSIGGAAAFRNMNNELESFNLTPSSCNKLIIGGTHFWGHADFYFAAYGFAGKGGVIRNQNYSSFHSSGFETVFKYYPWRIEHNKLRPFIGTGVVPYNYRQNDNREVFGVANSKRFYSCLLYTSPSPRDATLSRMPSSA